jgi:hypothetical protein
MGLSYHERGKWRVKLNHSSCASRQERLTMDQVDDKRPNFRALATDWVRLLTPSLP